MRKLLASVAAFALLGQFAFAGVTSLGTAANAIGATVVLTITANVPAGAGLLVCVTERQVVSGNGSFADSQSQTYTLLAGQPLNVIANGKVEEFGLANSVAMTSGVDTITFTKFTSGDAAALSAFIISPAALSGFRDAGTNAIAGGSSTTPSATSGTPANATETFIGCVGSPGNSGTYTQDSTHGTWATPPVEASSGTAVTDARLDGGFLTPGNANTQTYAPTLGVSSVWGEILTGFNTTNPTNLPLLGVGQ